jgi:superfamily II DNA/RNA helicase/very-short-patch-repair endonuclease
MDVFALRDQLVTDYRHYAASFFTIRDQRVRAFVEEQLKSGLLWPDPMLQLNPAFEPGGYVDELVAEGVLHPQCERIFRAGKTAEAPEGARLLFHKHQADAIRAAASGKPYVLTTGTGSGKSLAYMVPIVDSVLRSGARDGRIKAIVVYPMNALANSQQGELQKFLQHGFPKGQEPVRFSRYTGQETEEEREEIRANPPDILLTNYVMLEYLLTRPYDRKLILSAEGLRFLVLDELHTYRGRQGSDVALLIRRVRDACKAEQLQTVGTSATLAGPGTLEQQRKQVADVSSRLFGNEVEPGSVIGETLRRATVPFDTSDPAQLAALLERAQTGEPPATYEEFVIDPLARWIESTIGICPAEDDPDRLVRSRPRSLTGPTGIASELTSLTGVEEGRCIEALKATLLAGSGCQDPNGFRVFAFRLHQFLSGGSSVSASLEVGEERYLSTSGQQYVPGDRGRVLLPLAFCRSCGQEYYSVRETKHEEGRLFEPREISDRAQTSDERNGYLYISAEDPWDPDADGVLEKLPEDWIEADSRRVKRERRKNLPQALHVDPLGRHTSHGLAAAFVPAPFRFCLHCGVTHGARQVADFGKLATLGAGGRSTSTTVLGLAALRTLRQQQSLPAHARKLLSFTDNRQDASLQAGHFNDFIDVGLLRSALYRAATATGERGLRYDDLGERVCDALALSPEHYAADPGLRGGPKRDTDAALREVISYRLYRDLERGWRLTSPNLEQTGLLSIQYSDLGDACADEEIWSADLPEWWIDHDRTAHGALVTATSEHRTDIAKTLLDFLRRELAVKADQLDPDLQEKMVTRSNARLKPPWAIDEQEQLAFGSIAYPRPRAGDDDRSAIYLSPRGGFGSYLRRSGTFPNHPSTINTTEAAQLIAQLLGALQIYGLVEIVRSPGKDGSPPGFQVPAAQLRWVAGDGTTPLYDPIRMPRAPKTGAPTNPFFQDFYRNIAADGQGIEAREHTAQVPAKVREEREKSFREGRLPLLFCSPTMELGVDISSLNVVNLRNVPPTPANYAQRSGRAGRSGQPALVYTFCSSWNSHDQYFFRRPDQMVAGQVAPPQLDLANEDLVRAHVHAIWLAETGTSLKNSLTELLDVSGDSPTLELLPGVRGDLESAAARDRGRERATSVLAAVREELSAAGWFDEGWLDRVLANAALAFDQACERWRALYRAALAASKLNSAIIQDASRPLRDKNEAKRLRREAESQLDLLAAASGPSFQSDFYSYRYFASEGFLPGYNFPRLPLSAYIPARRARSGEDEYVSRPRFLAISEFGPQSIVYHEGARYVVNKVILPVASRPEQEGLPTDRAKLCSICGYLHEVGQTGGADLCERCGNALDAPMDALLRMQNVATRRRDRISSDEEERQRQGFEVRTTMRFAEHQGGRAQRTGEARHGETALAKLDYGQAATIWRVNLGWTRRANRDQLGFVLDTERGYWARSEQEQAQDPGDPLSKARRRVIPYVEDHRNCLLFEPTTSLGTDAMASLQAALKRGIQAVFQLEDQELAAEPLPTPAERRVLLFYESAEGGAGVLRRLLDDPETLSRVARETLEICHFDPETGEDRHRAIHATEDCDAACYDCLFSYSNQRDHRLLDRQLIRDTLLQLADADVHAAPGPRPPEEHLARLRRLCDSQLEGRFLDLVDEHRLRLPSDAQRLIKDAAARPDFVYQDHQVAVFIDGPPHDDRIQAERDGQATGRLEDLGWTVMRLHHADDWPSKLAELPSVFGHPADTALR